MGKFQWKMRLGNFVESFLIIIAKISFMVGVAIFLFGIYSLIFPPNTPHTFISFSTGGNYSLELAENGVKLCVFNPPINLVAYRQYAIDLNNCTVTTTISSLGVLGSELSGISNKLDDAQRYAEQQE